jgi:putative phosphoribosyl transferase
LVIAVPTAPRSVYDDFASEADEIVALVTPEPFAAVGLSYVHFNQTPDSEVTRLLAESRRPAHAGL